MVLEHPYGEAKAILKFDQHKKPVIIQETIDEIFNHDKVKDRKVVILSIIGAFRKGKSFFLDYCLRYLYAHYDSINVPNRRRGSEFDWMGESDEPLRGFSWRGGVDRETTGIIVWSDVFFHTIPQNGNKIAIIIMDTQGLFDTETSVDGNARVFSLGTLISSMQIVNLQAQIQEDHLQYLQFATEFAKHAASDQHQGQSGKPFGNLIFLIRDWQNSEEFDFGFEGGKNYLNKILKIRHNQSEDLKSVREFLSVSFEKADCFLLPHPGKRIAGGRKSQKPYDGNWGEMDEEFKDELKTVIENMLSSENLKLKEIHNIPLKGSKLKPFIEQYLSLFQSDTLPPALSIYEATVKNQLDLIVSKCVEFYKETIFKNRVEITSKAQIPIFHGDSKNAALLKYDGMRKMGSLDHKENFKQKLEQDLETLYIEWKDASEGNLDRIQVEMEKTRKAIEEKENALKEQLKSQKEAAEKLAEIERANTQRLIEDKKTEEAIQEQLRRDLTAAKTQAEKDRIETERLIHAEKLKHEAEKMQMKYQHEKNIAELRLEAEKARTKDLLALKRENDRIRDNFKTKIHSLENPKEDSEWSWCPIS